MQIIPNPKCFEKIDSTAHSFINFVSKCDIKPFFGLPWIRFSTVSIRNNLMERADTKNTVCIEICPQKLNIKLQPTTVPLQFSIKSFYDERQSFTENLHKTLWSLIFLQIASVSLNTSPSKR